MAGGVSSGTAHRIDIEFDDNRLLPQLFGEHGQHLSRIESQLGIHLASRGNRLMITGETAGAETARTAIDRLWAQIKDGRPVDHHDVDAALRMALGPGRPAADHDPRPAATDTAPGPQVRTKRRVIVPRTRNQARYLEAIETHELVFGLGPAGTGKTYLAVAEAVAMLLSGEVDRLILSRPAVEAGERLGFLPGDLREKVDPYLRPIYDALYDMLPAEQVVKRLAQGQIEVAPLAFMRGRTLTNAFVILDEAQNTTPVQMKMALTRLGENSRMVVTGDLSQIDLPSSVPSGLAEAVQTLNDVKGVAILSFEDVDVVRHPLVSRIVRAYENRAASASPPTKGAVR